LSPTEQTATLTRTLALAALILVIMALHSHSYSGRNYREDEINSVHAAMIKNPAEIVEWMAGDVHPPGWRLFADFWVDSFGGAEAITRWSSKLMNLLTYALLYQLGLHLGDRRTAFYAVAILGVYGFAGNAMAELRPYPMLIMLTAALHLVYYRWLRQPTSRLMLAYVVLGIAAIYTHFTAFFIFAAHALFLLAFHRFDRKVWLNSMLMWIFIALSFSVWLLPILYVILVPFSDGYYTMGLQTLYHHVRFNPGVVFGLLLLLSLFTPPRLITAHHQSRLRWAQRWNLLYPLFLLLAALAIIFLVHQVYTILHARTLQMLVTLVALLMALGLRFLPVQAGAILLILLYLHAPQNIAVQTANAPYREIVQSISASYRPDSVLITEFDHPSRWLTAAAYYLMDFTPNRMRKDRMLHLIDPEDQAHPPTFPDELANVRKSFDEADFAKLPDHQQLWLLRQGSGSRHSADLQQWLNQNYALLRTTAWDAPFPTSYSLSEYLRAPQSDAPVLFGDAMRLHSWALLDSVEVTPCQKSLTIESWWQLARPDDRPYTLTLILADSDGDGQAARADSLPAPANQFTTEWETDTYYRDQTELTIPCDIRAGSYNLLLAVKESLTGAPLPFRQPDGGTGREYYLTTLNALPEHP